VKKQGGSKEGVLWGSAKDISGVLERQKEIKK
jgi:hypothetical protein